MRVAITVAFLGAIALVVGWGALLEPMGLPLFPIAALITLPTLYFSWKETLLWVLPLGLLWEAQTPLVCGSVAIPLTVAALGLQVLARHQLRAHVYSQMLCAVILQSVVCLTIGLLWPPRTIAGVSLQITQACVALIMAAVIAPLTIAGFSAWLKSKFALSLEGRLKDL